jgi:hypothetical protein
MVGLCIGHDALFNKHSLAPVVTLLVKDRVLAHNPVAALYTAKFYYKRILDRKTFPGPRLEILPAEKKEKAKKITTKKK